MKHLIFIASIFLCGQIFGQDLIQTKDGGTYEAEIADTSNSVIKYKTSNAPEITFQFEFKEVQFIVYNSIRFDVVESGGSFVLKASKFYLASKKLREAGQSYNRALAFNFIGGGVGTAVAIIANPIVGGIILGVSGVASLITTINGNNRLQGAADELEKL